MNRRTAKAIHEVTNMSFWMENQDWSSGNTAFDLVCKGIQKLPFSANKALRHTFFDINRLLAVSGETVVAINTEDKTKVDKFMFRYPRKMSLESFENDAQREIGMVMKHLADIAMPTTVTTKPADIFKHVRKPPLAVTQSQPRLDLSLHPELNLAALLQSPHSPQLDRTARDLEKLAEGTDKLITDFGYFPDIANNSGNLRRSLTDGAITLIDVMPFYANGSRLIGDNPPTIIAHVQDNVAMYKDFAGKYGA